MEYNAPYGSPDPNASFVDRNTPSATSGSRVPAAAVEFPQREIMAVINSAGLTPSNGDLTQLLQAINFLIAAATGGAGDPNYVLMTQARSRLPIFPEVQTSDGALPIVSPGAGLVRVPAGYSFIHRGIYLVTTILQEFVTVASKTYHLRWNPTDGFALKDLADVAYNPAASAETLAIFDSKYDDMLVARVVTNPSNVPTVVTLSNKSQLQDIRVLTGTRINAASADGTRYNFETVLNWARTPKFLHSISRVSDPNTTGAIRDQAPETLLVSRYGMATSQFLMDYSSQYNINALFLAN